MGLTHFDIFPFGHWQVDWDAFGQRVHEMRCKNGMSMRDLEAMTEISAATICRAERGYSVEPDHFFTLLQFIGVHLDLPKEITKAGT